jgi:hypothetical protein
VGGDLVGQHGQAALHEAHGTIGVAAGAPPGDQVRVPPSRGQGAAVPAEQGADVSGQSR